MEVMKNIAQWGICMVVSSVGNFESRLILKTSFKNGTDKLTKRLTKLCIPKRPPRHLYPGREISVCSIFSLTLKQEVKNDV